MSMSNYKIDLSTFKTYDHQFFQQLQTKIVSAQNLETLGLLDAEVTNLAQKTFECVDKAWKISTTTYLDQNLNFEASSLNFQNSLRKLQKRAKANELERIGELLAELTTVKSYIKNKQSALQASAVDEIRNLIQVLAARSSIQDAYTALCYRKLGLAYAKLHLFQQSVVQLESSLKIHIHLNQPDAVTAQRHYELGGFYGLLDEAEKELSHYKIATGILEVCLQNSPPDSAEAASNYDTLGLLYRELKLFSKSLQAHRKALEIAQKLFEPTHSTVLEYKEKANDIELMMRIEKRQRCKQFSEKVIKVAFSLFLAWILIEWVLDYYTTLKQRAPKLIKG